MARLKESEKQEHPPDRVRIQYDALLEAGIQQSVMNSMLNDIRGVTSFGAMYELMLIWQEFCRREGYTEDQIEYAKRFAQERFTKMSNGYDLNQLRKGNKVGV